MDVLMPQLGETVAEGKISAWFKSVGDRVAAGDNLFEVETDKTAMEVPTTGAGVVAEIRVAAGETVPVGTVVAVISDGNGATAKTALQKVPPQKAPASSTSAPTTAAPHAPIAPMSTPTFSPVTPAPRAGAFDPFNEVGLPGRGYGPARLPSGVPITPLARRLAAEAGLDLNALKGSGPHGRVVARDIDGARPASPFLTSSLLAKGTASGPAAFEVVPHNAARRRDALAVATAKHAIPHFVVRRDVTVDTLLTLIDEINAADPTFRVSLVHCVTKALALALIKVPEANVQWADDHMLRFHQADIAVASSSGTTATIRAADRKGLAAIADETRAPTGELSGVATIWDMSGTGVSAISAIVRPPNTTALAIGTVAKRAIVDGNRPGIATCATLTLACDHRAIDGSVGARLIGACATLLERPLALIL